MASINPYLMFDSNAEEAFNFYKSVFGGEFLNIQRIKDTPEAGKFSEKDMNKIMHIALPIGNGNILMASDWVGPDADKFNPGNNIQLSIDTHSEKEAEEVFNKLSKGGKVTMPLADTFWGSYFGMCTDRFGIHWMVSFDRKNQK